MAKNKVKRTYDCILMDENEVYDTFKDVTVERIRLLASEIEVGDVIDIYVRIGSAYVPDPKLQITWDEDVLKNF